MNHLDAPCTLDQYHGAMNVIATAIGKRILALAGWEFLLLVVIVGTVYRAVEDRRSQEREEIERIRLRYGASRPSRALPEK